MAVCDLDSNRVDQGKTLINGYYAKRPARRMTVLPATTTITNCWPTKTSMQW